MDSVSHTRVARLLLDYVEQTTGVVMNEKAFYYGNLKPDLTGTYLTKRHYPSLMFDEVMEKIHDFCGKYSIDQMADDATLAVDLGEICHYVTDFFCYPHNDDIYPHNLFMHYIYEKRMTLELRYRLTEAKFQIWMESVETALRVDQLVAWLRHTHEAYKLQAEKIETDIIFICKMVATVVFSIIAMLQNNAVAETITA